MKEAGLRNNIPRKLMRNLTVRKSLVIMILMLVATLPGWADDRHGRIQIGTGLLYERGLDLTVGYEYETNYPACMPPVFLEQL